MPVTSPIASSQNADKLRSQPDIAKLKLAILQFLQPGVLPVLALALFVGGWSYGKKLSHYLHNTDVTKASTTRMWLDQRNDATIAPVAGQFSRTGARVRHRDLRRACRPRRPERH